MAQSQASPNPACRWALLHRTERCPECKQEAAWFQEACEKDETCWRMEAVAAAEKRKAKK